MSTFGKVLDPRGIGRAARPTREGWIPTGMTAKENRRSQNRGAEWSADQTPEVTDRERVNRAEMARVMIALDPSAALAALESGKLTREQKLLLRDIFREHERLKHPGRGGDRL
jgi:hypothetical protein